jgi:acetolactate synthase I/II/III large subunit
MFFVPATRPIRQTEGVTTQPGEPTNPETMSGGEAIIRSVQANGIDTVFGIPGAQVYPMFDALQRLAMRTIFPRHEQAAAYMAMGAANSTGKPACFAVVPGPGILNTTAALCTAMGTCSPVLGLTGQVPSSFLGRGRGHLHELRDQAGTLRSLIKDAYFIEDAAQSSNVINRAFQTMTSGRQGPVTVEMCWDTMAAPTQNVVTQPGITNPTRPVIDGDALDRAVDALLEAKRPLIMCGKGAQHASKEVLRLAELLGAPVTAFRSGRGVVAEDHPLGISSVAARELYDDADLIVGLGSRMEMIYTRWPGPGRFTPRQPGATALIRVDIDPDEMDRFAPDIAVVVDVADFCAAATQALEGRASPNKAWVEKIATAKQTAAAAIIKIQPQVDFLRVIREVLPRDGFMVPELSQMGFASYFAFPVYEPRTYVTEGFQGTLGYGFPTSLGVKVANPTKAVVSVTGDGGFLFGLQELATAAAHNIGAVTVLFNNNSYANVRRDQLVGYEGRFAGADLQNPDFMKLADSFGVAGRRVATPEALRTQLGAAIDADEPCLIEVETPTGSETNPWEFIHMATRPSEGM